MLLIPRTRPQIAYVVEIQGEFKIFRNNAAAVGDWRVIAAPAALARGSITNYVLITRGAVRYSPMDESFAPVNVAAGEDNQKLPGWGKGQLFLIEALTADAEFLCIVRLDQAQFARSVSQGVPVAQLLSAAGAASVAVSSSGFTVLCSPLAPVGLDVL